MLVIKRYPNRKLYDTVSKKYITLDGIAAMIRKGTEVKVVDHTTDEDLTAVTLTQIIFEQEKKKGGFLPTSILTGLVQAGGETVTNIRKTLTSPMEILQQVDEEIDKRIQHLISRGEMAKEEAMGIRDKLLSAAKLPEKPSLPGQNQIERLLASRGVPSKNEINEINLQIDALNKKLESIMEESSAEKSEK
ncbi:MAG: polyhydroxyalkanoate synthesis regulator DNA-binding domain-containing protein [Chloroflexota bacterium]